MGIEEPAYERGICRDLTCGCQTIQLRKAQEKVKTFTTGAQREDSSDKLDFEGFLSPIVLDRFGQYMHFHKTQVDGSVRASDNWQGGIPRKVYIKSLIRHVFEAWRWWRGYELRPKTPRDPQTIEDVLCAIMFNTQGLLFEILSSRDVGE